MHKFLVSLLILTISTAIVAASVAADSQHDVQTLVNKVMPIAEELLLEHGEFFPFGGAMKIDNEVVTLSGLNGSPVEQPDADDVVDTLEHSLKIGAENNNYKATAIVSNVHVTPPGEKKPTMAVALRVDHLDNISLILIFPYQIVNNQVELGQLFARGGENKIFER